MSFLLSSTTSGGKKHDQKNSAEPDAFVSFSSNAQRLEGSPLDLAQGRLIWIGRVYEGAKEDLVRIEFD